jgi:hypothetical protein
MIDELLAPLAPEEPTDDEIRQLLARADRRTRRRRIRIGAVTAAAAVAVTATLAALPSDPNAPPAAPLSAAALLNTAAAVAAEQPGPASWTGFRYVQQVERRTTAHYTLEVTDESWTSSDWQGVRLTTGARIVAGHLPTPEEQRADWRRRFDRLPAAQRTKALASLADATFPDESRILADRRIETPKDMPNLYGDAALAKVPLSALPTDPARLGALLIDAHRDGRWTPGGSWRPLESDVKYDVLRDILLLLTEANATPAQRAALIAVLRNYQGVTPLEDVKDQRGRTGNGVEIPTGRATVRVLFSPDTSELLEWSEPNEVHTYLRFDHVLAPPEELDGK